MKPKIFSILLLLLGVGVSAFAQISKSSETVSQIIAVKEPLTSLIIQDDISVVLTETANGIVVVGDEKAVRGVRIMLDENEVILSSFQPNAASGVKVFVPASFLRKIVINSNGDLSSSSILSNPSLRVLVGGEAKVQLRSSGKLTVEGTDGYEFIRMTR